MSKSEEIRSLATEGLPVAEIARRMGIRYQHVYSVLKAAGQLAAAPNNLVVVSGTPKPSRAAASERLPLSTAILVEGGFQKAAEWVLTTAGVLAPNAALPKERGVYAFVCEDCAAYVGLATMGLAKRLYFYARPGRTQRTSLRLNRTLKSEIAAGRSIEIYTATPPALEWNGLPVAGDAGLELGLIQTFHLPWNIRGT